MGTPVDAKVGGKKEEIPVDDPDWFSVPILLLRIK